MYYEYLESILPHFSISKECFLETGILTLTASSDEGELDPDRMADFYKKLFADTEEQQAVEEDE